MSIQFLEHQREAYQIIQSGEYREVWWYGSIRAGKTVGHGAGQTWRMIRYPGDYIIANSTAGNVWAVQWPLIHAFAQRAGVSARERGGRQPYIQVGKSKGWVVGLQSAGSHRPHMGKTTRGGWYSEVSLYNQDSFDLILGRGSARNAMHLMDSNPDGPAHWMAGYIREVEKRKGYARRVHIRENVHLDPEYISYVESIYTLPHLRARYIDGEFAAGTGIVYQYIPEVDSRSSDGRLAVSADAGASGVTAALFAREQRDGTWVVFDEYYHDARTRVQIGEGAHADAIIARHGIPDVCVVDGPNLRHEMATRGAWASLPDKTDKEANVGHLDACFRGRRLTFLAGTCENARREFATLEWDAAARLRGVSQPVDSEDHTTDCGIYLAKAVIPKWTLGDIDGGDDGDSRFDGGIASLIAAGGR